MVITFYYIFSSSKALSPVVCVPTKRRLKRVKMKLKTQVLGSEAKEKFQVRNNRRSMAMVVAPLVEKLLPTSEVCGLNPVMEVLHTTLSNNFSCFLYTQLKLSIFSLNSSLRIELPLVTCWMYSSYCFYSRVCCDCPGRINLKYARD